MRTAQVFVSHTSDMAGVPAGRSFVQAVLDGIGRAGLAPVDMRYFPAREGQPTEYCRQRVRDCEIYAAVVGFRYGSLVPGESISYTELEFVEATRAGLPRLVFLLDESVDLAGQLTDADRGAVDAFRRLSSSIVAMLTAMEEESRTGGLPRFIPAGADIARLTQTPRVREGVRSASLSANAGDRATDNDVPDPRPVLDWSDLTAAHQRVVVVGDAGMGKTWLIRSETGRQARSALAALRAGVDIDDVAIPVPIRCDELATAAGPTLADSLSQYLSERYGLPSRSRTRLRCHIAGGMAGLLLDALDEVPDPITRKRINDLVLPWTSRPAAQFVITSRIAGYTYVPAHHRPMWRLSFSHSPPPTSSRLSRRGACPPTCSLASPIWCSTRRWRQSPGYR